MIGAPVRSASRAGPVWPHCPFGFGLYGGTNSPGFLASDPAADPFFKSLGYEPAGTTLVFQKKLDAPLSIPDARFSMLRRRYETQVMRAPSVPTWWHECVWGTLDPVELFNIGLQVFTNPMIWQGILLLGLFFGLYLAALSWADLSFVLPVTAFSYAMNAFMAWRFIGEHVSITRWIGTLIICVGVAAVSRTEQRTTRPEPGGVAG